LPDFAVSRISFESGRLSVEAKDFRLAAMPVAEIAVKAPAALMKFLLCILSNY